jgi:hypothetical protein
MSVVSIVCSRCLDRRAAKVAFVIARAIREGEVAASDGLRTLRRELRRRNTNRTRGLSARFDELARGALPRLKQPPRALVRRISSWFVSNDADEG